jgi:hypothetical protein
VNRKDKRWWLQSGLLLLALIIAAILVAQSRRNCEIPGSTYVPCIWGEPLGKRSPRNAGHDRNGN